MKNNDKIVETNAIHFSPKNNRFRVIKQEENQQRGG